MGSFQVPQGWGIKNDALQRDFSFADFLEAWGFLSRVALLAEVSNHHPKIETVYNRVSLTLCTHDAGDIITQKDIALAEAINRLLD